MWQFPVVDSSTTTPVNSLIIEVFLDDMLVQTNYVSDPNITRYVVSRLNSGRYYYIQVAGINSRGNGNFSELRSALTYYGIARRILYVIK